MSACEVRKLCTFLIYSLHITYSVFVPILRFSSCQPLCLSVLNVCCTEQSLAHKHIIITTSIYSLEEQKYHTLTILEIPLLWQSEATELQQLCFDCNNCRTLTHIKSCLKYMFRSAALCVQRSLRCHCELKFRTSVYKLDVIIRYWKLLWWYKFECIQNLKFIF